MDGKSVLETYAELAESDPAEALIRVDEFAGSHGADEDHALRARLRRIASLAARDLNDLPRSNELLQQASADATRSTDHLALVEVELTRSYNLFLMGDAEAAVTLVSSLEAPDQPAIEGRIAFQHGTILARSGDRPGADRLLDRAGALADAGGDPLLSARVAKNRGMMAIEQGQPDRASVLLHEARRRFVELGIDVEVAYVEHCLGLTAAAIGDLPDAFRHFEAAEVGLVRLGIPEFESMIGRCHALLAGGLFSEAASVADVAARRCEAVGLAVDEAELRIVQAQALRSMSRLDEAVDQADIAAEQFRSQGRNGRAASADLLRLLVLQERGSPPTRAEVLAIIEDLERGGLGDDVLRAKLLHAEVLAIAGRRAEVMDVLSETTDVSATAGAHLRLAAVTSEAFCHRQLGEADAAHDRAREGLRLLAEEQAVIGATDLRVGLRQHTGRLSTIGLELAVERGDEAEVLWWIERMNLAAGTPDPVRPPSDRELQRALAALRSLEPSQVAERRDLEAKVSDIYRAQRSAAQDLMHPERGEDLVRHLGTQKVLTLGMIDGRLIGIVVDDGDLNLVELGDSGTVQRAVRALRADLRRRAVDPRRRRSDRALRALERLDAQLLGPFDLGSAPLVVTGPAAVLALPWIGLPSRRGVPTTLSSSISSWAAAPLASPVRSADVVLISGPDLDHAGAEISAVADAYDPVPDGRLHGDSATVELVRGALDEASVAHIVAHGHVRVDNPLLSSLRMADGDLSVYELGDLERAPSVVILSACHVGLAAEAPGQELLGMVTGFLNTGARCVIASTLPVPDHSSTVRLMTHLHQFLADGRSPAEAWAEVQRTCADDEELLDTASFTVFGRG